MSEATTLTEFVNDCAWSAGVATEQIQRSIATDDLTGVEYHTRRLIAYTKAIRDTVKDMRARVGTEGVA